MAWSNWWGFSSEYVQHDTDALGVYELADTDKNTVYYGRGQIKTRLEDHLNKKECPLAKYYRIENFGTEEECRAREEQLLADYKKTHGKLPMYNERTG